MLINLFGWLYVVCLAYIYGVFLSSPCSKTTNLIVCSQVQNLPFRLLIGIALMAILSNFLSLFIPLGLEATVISILLALLFLLIKKQTIYQQCKNELKEIQSLPSEIVVIWVVILCLLIYQSSVGPFHYDTGLYHAAAVDWLDRYGTVVGLGNLHHRFAYNSMWLSLNALVNFSSFLIEPLHNLNGLVLLICLTDSLFSILKLRQKQVAISDYFRFLSFFPLLMLIYDSTIYSVDVASLSTDLPVSAITLVIIGRIIGVIESLQEERFDTEVTWQLTILLCFVFCIKLSSLPLMIWALYLIGLNIHLHKWLEAKIAVGIMSIMLILQLTRNFIISGYLIYPVQITGLWKVDWKIPQDILLEDKLSIQSWARIPAYNSQAIIEQGLQAWFPIWFKLNFDHGTLLLFLIAIPIFLAWSIFNKDVSRDYLRIFLPIHSVLTFAIVFWFVSAPAIRFAYGNLTGIAIFSLVPILAFFIQHSKIYQNNSKILSKGYLLIALLFCISRLQFYPSDYQYLLSPMQYPSIETQEVTLSNFQVFQPISGVQGNDQCWRSAFPCTPYVHPDLKLRGKSFKNGFKIETINN